MTALLELRGVCYDFAAPRSALDLLAGRPRVFVRAVDSVDLSIAAGECLGLIGESGSGKSTLGRLALRLRAPTAGTVRFSGADLGALSPRALTSMRPRMQIIFQDPYASLNPRRNVEEIVALPLLLHTRLSAAQRREQIVQALEWVGLGPEHLHRYPHQFSGGQRQRIGVARALVLRPKFVVCDEPVSALDVSVQAQIVTLLARLRQEFGLAYLFISHDIAVVAHLSDRIAVMYLGRIVETGRTRHVIASPRHPYTQALLSAVPRPYGAPSARIRLTGDPPSAVNPPSGCAFHTRCPHALPVCRCVQPRLTQIGRDQSVACHLVNSPVSGDPLLLSVTETSTCSP